MEFEWILWEDLSKISSSYFSPFMVNDLLDEHWAKMCEEKLQPVSDAMICIIQRFPVKNSVSKLDIQLKQS